MLTQISAFWFDRTRAHRPQSHLLDRSSPTYPAEARAARRRCCAGRSMLVTTTEPLPIECVARGYLSGSGWKDYQATGEVCGIAAAGRAARIRSAAAADLHAGHQGDERPRHQHQRSRSGARSSARRCSTSVTATDAAHSTREGAAHAESLRHHRRRHEIRVRPPARRRTSRSRRPHHPHRRSADARLVALLAAGQLQARRRAAELRQAVRARLPRIDQVEQAAARAVAARRRRSRKRARNMSRRSAA